MGRPVDLPFSEASGWFEVQVRAAPTTVQAEMPLTFTLTIRAMRPPRRPPVRLDLRQLPDFAEQFYIEDPSEEAARPDERTWEFAYRLKPRRTDVREIPSLPFVYFNPHLLTASKGFQVLYTDPIPLRVLPHESVQVPVQAPEIAFVLATGPAVLERQTPWSPPSLGTIAVLLLAPPLGCVAWYLIWRRLYPNAARLANQRRSRAARHALQALHAARRLDDEARAARTAALVAGYLQARLDLAIAEPTPREVADLFARLGFSSALTEQAVRFFETSDSARFLPVEGGAGVRLAALHDSAIQLILAVEAAEEEEKKRRRGEEEKYSSALFSPFLFFSSSPLLLFSSSLLLFSSSPFLLFSSSPLLASPIPATLSDRDVLERAEAEFREGVQLRLDRDQARPHFRNAAGYFEELRQRGSGNAALYRNLGNAYLLADDLPDAILSYHRGLRLSPNDLELRESLAEARQQVVFPASGDLGRPRNDDRPPWLPHPRSTWLMFTAMIFYVLGCLGVTRWRMLRRGRLLTGGLLAFLLAGALSGWLTVRAAERSDNEAHPLVVIASDGVLLRRGNGVVFPPRFDTPVNRGVEGRLLFERGGWVQIELAGGEIGWVPHEAVLVDAP
ncbi:MAG: hypothetical protein ACYC3I_17630 [Gemmataceae bacterium]